MRKNDNIEKSGKMSLLLYTRDGPRSSPLRRPPLTNTTSGCWVTEPLRKCLQVTAVETQVQIFVLEHLVFWNTVWSWVIFRTNHRKLGKSTDLMSWRNQSFVNFSLDRIQTSVHNSLLPSLSRFDLLAIFFLRFSGFQSLHSSRKAQFE